MLPWLADAQRMPHDLPADAPDLPPIPTDNWPERRAEVHDSWLQVMGEFPPRPTLHPQVLSSEAVKGDVIRELLRYEIEDGIFVEAYVCRPDGDGPYPGVVVLHPTVNASILEPAGLASAKERQLGLNLARRGYVTISPRCFLWDDRNEVDSLRDVLDPVMTAFHARHPHWTGIGKMTWDAMCATDILVARDDVDGARIGSVGHSLGAKEALYHAAFDDRVGATVSSEGGIGVAFSNWHDPWYLGGQAKSSHFMREHHELMALIAPRAFLLLGGGSADGERSWPFIRSVLPLYESMGAGERVAFINHRQGHAFPRESESALYEWLDEFLMTTGDDD
ncbi:dienelactone hydrolase [Candidatus Poribacteria bacterium]|jgi:dienelactone hydrolase|nr:dienelactone hydrolase [Candidatus Poribacteria bacterium]MBT5714840.1 dienelactone hydrolase [Candidatus Poribacteria bacterium]MBT7804025.1 dienelactone hydrolase [Candidatus Poribacteria bacterium]